MRIGTFNLNNLFGRFNFHGAVDEINQGHDTVTVTYTFTDADDYRLERDSHGLLVAKPADERATLAGRIGNAGLDVLAVQEVEDLDTLRRFNRDHLDGSFGHLSLLEGNDPRFIDVAVLSRHPLGATTFWQHAIHPDAPSRRVFGRDLVEVDVLSPSRSRRLLRLYVGHVKSHYVDWRLRGEAREEAIEQANLRRRQQAEMTAQIVQARTRPDSPYLVLGDFNDPPACQQVGAPAISSHGLRHTVVSWMVDAGHTAEQIGWWIGGSPQIVATVYAHMLVASSTPAAATIDSALRRWPHGGPNESDGVSVRRRLTSD